MFLNHDAALQSHSAASCVYTVSRLHGEGCTLLASGTLAPKALAAVPATSDAPCETLRGNSLVSSTAFSAEVLYTLQVLLTLRKLDMQTHDVQSKGTWVYLTPHYQDERRLKLLE